MALWPFDRETLVRYGGLLISPITPLVVNQFPRIMAALRGYVGLQP